MCVLTYVPITSNGFIVTSNRDENVDRPKAKPPKKIKIHGVEVFCPIDPSSKGTWIATSKNYTTVLLNGGSKKHSTKASYRQSRGQIILEFMKWNNPEKFFREFDFEGIEPFTLCLFDNENRNKIIEIKWCENSKIYIEHDGSEPHIWSSVTLYSNKAIEKRKSWFFEHLETSRVQVSASEVLNFHHNGGSFDNKNSINLSRKNGIKTVSITQIEILTNGKSIFYEELDTKNSSRYRIF